MTQKIVFGTDGWRAVIADDFTFANLDRVALATARTFAKHPRIRNGIVVGYDARFMSREFAERVALVMAGAGVRVSLADAIVSTPMVSLATLRSRAAAGIVITASHNPARYNGFKIKGDFGGPAHPEMVTRVEKELARVLKLKRLAPPPPSLDAPAVRRKVQRVSMRGAYLEEIRQKIDVERLARANLRILVDAMHGAGMGVFPELVAGVTEMRAEYNPSFGGVNPEPLAKNLQGLMQRVRREGFTIGIATDGDADRVGAVDEQGAFVDSHRIFSLVLKYLVEDRKMTGEVAKSFSVSTMVDAQCRKYGLTLHETPVGFKHLCRLMTERDILIAGEESGGLGIKGHIPERDGVLLGLLLCEMMAVRGKPLSVLVQELMEEFGHHEFRRVDLHVGGREKEAIMKRFARGLRSVGGYAVRERKDTDGVKYLVDGGWLLVRASGTEPLIRVYAEGSSSEQVDALLREATGDRSKGG